MNKPMVKEFNAETQEEITREMTDFEYEQLLIANVEVEEQTAKEEAKAEAKRQALAALGLSQEIVNLLAE
jgi:hypothetical protein